MRDYRTLNTRFMFSRAPADPRPLNEDKSIHEAFGSWSFFWVYHHLNLITNIDHLTKDLRCHLWGLAWNINQFDADLWIFIAPLAFCARTRGAGSCLAQQKAPSAAAASAKWDFYWNDSSKSAARRDKMLGRWQQLPNVLRRRGGGGCELRTEKELRHEARYQQWVSVCMENKEGKNHRWLLLLFLSHWIWFHGSCDFQSFRSSSRSRSVHASKHKQKHSNVCIGLFLSGKRCDGFTCHEVVNLCSQHRTCK